MLANISTGALKKLEKSLNDGRIIGKITKCLFFFC
jgi:hypothetical protein